ncbi:hypothetical protein QBC33DRAFT_427744, partial [Phialemonium atrogriseum]
DEDGDFIPFWYSKTGVIVKWSLFLGLIVIVTLYLLVGYMHAKRRIRKGLPPLGYHRFLVSRTELARVDPRYAFPQRPSYGTYYPPSQYYGMHAMPPPVYDPEAPRPPVYEGAKVDPSQAGPGFTPEPTRRPTEPAPDYSPPAGPPPGASR